MFLGMEQVSSLSRLLNLHRLLQQKESNQLKKESKRKKAFGAVGAGFCALLGMLTACTQPAPTSQESGYKTMTVKKENRLLTNSYSAVVKGRQSVEIRPQVSGTITEICVKEGAKVHKGPVLFVIDQVALHFVHFSVFEPHLGECEKCGSCRGYGPPDVRQQGRALQGACGFGFRPSDGTEFFVGG